MWRIPLWCQNSPPMTWENGYNTWTKSQNRHERKKISYVNPAPTASSVWSGRRPGFRCRDRSSRSKTWSATQKSWAGLELVANPHELIKNMVENPGFWPDFPLNRLMECGFNMTVSHAGLTGLPICRWQKKRTLKRGWAVYSDGKSAQISPFATIKRVYVLKLEILQHKWQPNGRPLLCSSAANTIFSFGQFSSVASLDVNGWGGGQKAMTLEISVPIAARGRALVGGLGRSLQKLTHIYTVFPKGNHFYYAPPPRRGH